MVTLLTQLEELKRWLAVREAQRPNRFASLVLRTVRFLTTVVISFQNDQCLTHATALTLTSLLSLVPLTAVFFSIFSAFEAFERLKAQTEAWIFETFIASQSLRQTVSQYLDGYTQATTKMEIFNVVALLVTVVLLFIAIEHSMNVIWRVRRKRSYFEAVKSFTSLLVWAPLLLALSTYLSAWLSAALAGQSGEQTWYVRDLQVLRTNVWTLRFFRFGVSWFLFFCAYELIPYTRVKFGSAALGAFVASNAWEAAKTGFEVYLTRSDYQWTIYGQLSVIPIFLLWLYLSWVLLLFGAELAFCHQNRRILRRRVDAFDEQNLPRAEMAMALYVLMAERFGLGEGPVSLDRLAWDLGLPADLAVDLFERLQDRGLVCAVSVEERRYVPARSLESVTLKEVREALEPVPFLGEASRERSVLGGLSAALAEVRQATGAILGARSVAGLLGASRGAEAEAVAQPESAPRTSLRKRGKNDRG